MSIPELRLLKVQDDLRRIYSQKAKLFSYFSIPRVQNTHLNGLDLVCIYPQIKIELCVLDLKMSTLKLHEYYAKI